MLEGPAGGAGAAVLAVGAFAEMDVCAVGGVVVAAVGAGDLVEGLPVVGARDAERADVDLPVVVREADFGGGVVGHVGSLASGGGSRGGSGGGAGCCARGVEV